MRSAWRRLADTGALRTPFELPGWAESLDAAGLGSTVRVLTVTGPAGAVLGLLPLEWSPRGERPRAVSAMAASWLAPDEIDVIAEPEHRAVTAAAVVADLRATRDFDVLHLESLRTGGALAGALSRLRPSLSLPTEPVLAPYVDLSRGRDGLPWSRNLRQQVSRGLRSAERAGGALEVAREPSRVCELLDVLMRLHVERFGATSQIFATAPRRRFAQLAATRLATEGQARVYRLTVGTADAALLYALRVGDRLFYYSMGLAPAVGGSPGRTVLGQAILAAADEGLAEFDLLRGDHEFKLRFASGTRTNDSVRLLRPTPLAVRYAAGKATGKVARRVVQRVARRGARDLA